MPKYNTSCTKCGKALHHKQVIFEKKYIVQLYSCLIKDADTYTIRLCKECCSELLSQSIDSANYSDFVRYIKRYGEKN